LKDFHIFGTNIARHTCQLMPPPRKFELAIEIHNLHELEENANEVKVQRWKKKRDCSLFGRFPAEFVTLRLLPRFLDRCATVFLLNYFFPSASDKDQRGRHGQNELGKAIKSRNSSSGPHLHTPGVCGARVRTINIHFVPPSKGDLSLEAYPVLDALEY
jgi:hypothetical protein